MRDLEQENVRLKKIVADLSFDKETLVDAMPVEWAISISWACAGNGHGAIGEIDTRSQRRLGARRAAVQ